MNYLRPKFPGMKMRTINPGEIPTKDFHQFLLGTVAPRPIAFVSTLDENGRPNLAPYSFFNAFSSNPPIVVFSSNRRVADNTTKDTLHNVRLTGECVINAVSYSIVRQMAVASVQFEPGINEFEKSGLTPIASELVKPFRVKESPAHLECKVREVVTLGDKGGAGHMVICDVLRIHISEDVIEDNDRINPHKMDLMGRMGRAYYVRASGDAIHTIVQAVEKIAIGYDALPESVRTSTVLTGNHLGLLAGAHDLPDPAEVDAYRNSPGFMSVLSTSNGSREAVHRYATELLDAGKRDDALCALLIADGLV